MAGPTTNQLKGVRNSQTPVTPEQREKLIQLLALAGYDHEALAKHLRCDGVLLAQMFDGKKPVSNATLAEICELFQVVPGVIQEKCHFRPGYPKRRGRERQKWIPKELLEGHDKTGQTFSGAWRASGKGCGVTQSDIKLIEKGRKAIPLHALRCVVAKLRKQATKPAMFSYLCKLVDSVPAEFQTFAQINQKKQTQGKAGTMTEINWTEKTVVIDGVEYSIAPGETIQKVAVRIDFLRKKMSETTGINDLLNAAGAGVQGKSQLLGSVRRGTATLHQSVLENLTELLPKVSTVDQLFTWQGMEFPDPADQEKPTVKNDTSHHWARDKLFERGTVLREGVNPHDLLDLFRQTDDSTVDWLTKYVEMTKEGEKLEDISKEVADKLRSLGKDAQTVFLAMLQAQFLSSGADNP